MVAPVVLALIPLPHTQCSVLLPCLFPGTFKASLLDVPIQFCGGGAILRLAEAQVGQVDLS